MTVAPPRKGFTLLDGATDAVLLVSSLALIPAAEWLSLVRMGTVASVIVTPPKVLAAMLGVACVGKILRQPGAVVAPSAIVVFLLSGWTVVANYGRADLPSESLRSAVYFAVTASVAFCGAFLAGGGQRRYRRALVSVLLLMLIIGAGAGLVERLTAYRTGSEFFSGIEWFWSFLRPPAAIASPVLGDVYVINTHAAGQGPAPRVAGLFATTNSYADFIAASLPLVVLTWIAVARRWPLWRSLLYLVLLAGTITMLVWTVSRIGIVALLVEAILVAAIVLRLRPRDGLKVAGVAVLGIGLLIVAALADPDLPRRLTSLGLIGNPAVTEVGRADPGALSNAGHLGLQLVAVDMLVQDPDSLLRGPGLYAYLRRIFDATDPARVVVNGVAPPGIGGPHSVYLTFAVVGGVPAFGLFLLLVALALVPAVWRVARRSPPDRWYLGGLALSLIGWLLVGAVDTDPYSFPQTAFLFTLLGALSGSASSAPQRQTSVRLGE